MSDQVQTREDAERAIHKILRQFNIEIEHPQASIDEAAQREAHPHLDDPSLALWQNDAFITIDNPDSRDLDQALLIERQGDGGYRVRYALADAAFYAPPGSALFTEALKRGVTYYTPLLAAPMLPPSLSEGIVSLNPNVLRRALVFDMSLTDDAHVNHVSIVRALIQSQAKLSYEGVQAFLDAEQAQQAHDVDSSPWAESMRLLKELGEKLIQHAHDRDVIPFNRREANIALCETGMSLSPRARVRTEKYNEQISLLCNMQGALMLQGLAQDNEQLQAIFRAHDAPLENRLKSLRTLLNDFADTHQLDKQWRWQPDQSLADYVNNLPDDPESLSHVLAIERQILVCNQASEYRRDPHRHHALAAVSYARFSSPMREIVGIFTHKELLEALGTSPSNYDVNAADVADDNALREHIISIANQSRQTQKQISKRVEFVALQSVLGKDLASSSAPKRRGIIMGFKRDRIYIGVEDLAIDLKVTTSDLEAQYSTSYETSDLAARPASDTAPVWQLGDTVSVSTVGFDQQNKRFQLALHATV